MNELSWVCERCQRVFDLEKGEGWITLVEDEDSHRMGKLSPAVPYEEVCYECADELLAVVERCDRGCGDCDVTVIWASFSLTLAAVLNTVR